MRIAIALSGGVDSAVAAKILQSEGHQLVGLFLKLWSDSNINCGIKENRCCDYQALTDARAVANHLRIPFYVINAEKEFKKAVVDYFIDEYRHLRTPNPCVVCNNKIKFDLLLKKAEAIGCEKLATGHYARIEDARIFNFQFSIFNKIPNSKFKNKNLTAKTYHLKAGIDQTKDQSYMLYRLKQDQLKKIIFPLGEMKKKDVRELAVKWNLPVKEKPESQEICFFSDKDYRDFLRRYLPSDYFKPGEIRDLKGKVMGEHKGLVNYTLGQRKGVAQDFSPPTKLRIKRNYEITNHTNCHSELAEESSNRKPMYVVGFKVEKNQLIVGEDKETFSKEMIVDDINWIDPNSYNLTADSLTVKIRYRHEAVKCQIKNQKLNIKNMESITVIFDDPQRAITPGQSAVFYLNDQVLGGGIIKRWRAQIFLR